MDCKCFFILVAVFPLPLLTRPLFGGSAGIAQVHLSTALRPPPICREPFYTWYRYLLALRYFGDSHLLSLARRLAIGLVQSLLRRPSAVHPSSIHSIRR